MVRSLSCLLLVSALVPGCARLDSVRVVDSASEQPVENVVAARLEGKIQPTAIPLVFINSMAPAEKKSTDAAGAAKFDKKGGEFGVNPTFGNPDFGRAFVSVGLTGAKIRYPDEHREVRARAVNGVITVPLRRIGDSSDLSKTAGDSTDHDKTAKDSADHAKTAKDDVILTSGTASTDSTSP